MTNEIVVGLDIGTTKIACFVGTRAENGKVKIIGFGKTNSVGVERGVVKNIDDAAESIRHAVKDAADQANVEIDEVWVGIAGQHIKSRPSEGQILIPDNHQRIMQEDVENLISQQYCQMLPPGEEIIHIFPQDYIVDGEVLSREISPVGVRGKTLAAKFHMVTGNANAVQNIRDAVQEAGLSIKGLALEPIASSMAVLSDTELDAGVALVDIGGGTTDIAVFHDGIIRHTSVLPLAGNVITNDIREGCNILKHQAESLKIKFGSCVPSAVSENDVVSIPGVRSQPPREIYMKTLAGIINVRTKVLLEQVGYEISVSGYAKKLIAGVVLTGGGSRLKNIKELCELVTATDTRIGTPDEHLAQGTVSPDELAHPMFATGIGLVLFGLARVEEQERVSPAAHKEEEKEKEKPLNPHDIFADMEEVKPQAPEPQPAAQPAKPAKQRGHGFGRTIQEWLDSMLKENIN